MLKFYRLGGLLVFPVALDKIYGQILFCLHIIKTHGPAEDLVEHFFTPFTFIFKGIYYVYPIEKYLLNAPAAGVVAVPLLIISLRAMLKCPMGRSAKLFLTAVAASLFFGHLMSTVRLESFLLYHPAPFYNWFLSESFFYFSLIGSAMMVLASPASDPEKKHSLTAGLVKLVLSLTGRMSRRTFWLCQFLGIGLVMGLCDFAGAVSSADVSFGYSSVEGRLIVVIHMVLLIFWPMIAFGAKRCHDRNKSGWYQLLGLIPLVNLYYTVEMFFFPGTKGENRFGSDPQIRLEKSC